MPKRTSPRPGAPAGRGRRPRSAIRGGTDHRARRPRRARGGEQNFRCRTPPGCTARRCRRCDVHCACCGGCSCPKGSPGGHRTPEPPPQRTLLTRTSSRAARPAALHMATTARRLVLPSVSRGACGLFGALRKYLEDHFRPVRPTPAPPSHTNLQIRPYSRCWPPYDDAPSNRVSGVRAPLEMRGRWEHSQPPLVSA